MKNKNGLNKIINKVISLQIIPIIIFVICLKFFDKLNLQLIIILIIIGSISILLSAIKALPAIFKESENYGYNVLIRMIGVAIIIIMLIIFLIWSIVL